MVRSDEGASVGEYLINRHNILLAFFEMLLGKEALQTIKDMKLTIPGLRTVIIALSAIVNEVDFEEMEKRFQFISFYLILLIYFNLKNRTLTVFLLLLFCFKSY